MGVVPAECSCSPVNLSFSKHEHCADRLALSSWGLTLRSGWGVAKDERSGFKWLSKACESQAAEPEAQMNRPSDKAGGEAAVISVSTGWLLL